MRSFPLVQKTGAIFSSSSNTKSSWISPAWKIMSTPSNAADICGHNEDLDSGICVSEISPMRVANFHTYLKGSARSGWSTRSYALIFSTHDTYRQRVRSFDHLFKVRRSRPVCLTDNSPSYPASICSALPGPSNSLAMLPMKSHVRARFPSFAVKPSRVH